MCTNLLRHCFWVGRSPSKSVPLLNRMDVPQSGAWGIQAQWPSEELWCHQLKGKSTHLRKCEVSNSSLHLQLSCGWFWWKSRKNRVYLSLGLKLHPEKLRGSASQILLVELASGAVFLHWHLFKLWNEWNELWGACSHCSQSSHCSHSSQCSHSSHSSHCCLHSSHCSHCSLCLPFLTLLKFHTAVTAHAAHTAHPGPHMHLVYSQPTLSGFLTVLLTAIAADGAVLRTSAWLLVFSHEVWCEHLVSVVSSAYKIGHSHKKQTNSQTNSFYICAICSFPIGMV